MARTEPSRGSIATIAPWRFPKAASAAFWSFKSSVRVTSCPGLAIFWPRIWITCPDPLTSNCIPPHSPRNFDS